MDAALRSMSQPKGVVALTADSTTFIGGEDVPSSVELRWRPGDHTQVSIRLTPSIPIPIPIPRATMQQDSAKCTPSIINATTSSPDTSTAKSSASAVSLIATNFRETADLLVAEALTIALGRHEGAYEEQLEAALATQRAEPRSSKSSG